MSFEFKERLVDIPFVEGIWWVQSQQDGTFPSVAETCWEMVLHNYAGKTTFVLRGPETKATMAESPADTEFMGIRFKPGTYMPHLLLSAIMDRQDFDLPDAIPNSSFYLYDSVWEYPTFDNVDVFLDRLVRKEILVYDPVVETVLEGHQPDLSARSIQRRFVHVTGMTQKTIQQIERAKHATSLLQQGTSIIDTVFEAGYYDQSHLTNSLTHYMGQTPAQMVKQEQTE